MLTRTWRENALYHKCIIHGDDGDLVDALLLEPVMLLNLSNLGATCGQGECPTHAN